ncbi:putative translation initiation factor 3 complex subunit L [Helianthus debilis subsp. tardiflorus]
MFDLGGLKVRPLVPEVLLLFMFDLNLYDYEHHHVSFLFITSFYTKGFAVQALEVDPVLAVKVVVIDDVDNFQKDKETMDVVLDLYRSTNERVENKMCMLYRVLMMSDHLPSLEDVKQEVGNNIFYTLYVEIWYRHPGSSSNPTFRQRLGSWDNYCRLFKDLIPGLSDRLFPYQWLWDMVDEFVNQFHSFSELRATDPTKLNKICQVRQAGIIRQVSK